MNEEKMGSKKILPLLVEFSIPAMIGMVVNAIYNMVDRMFIGNAPELGSTGLAAVSITYPIVLIMMAVGLMIGVGGATRFSICLGQGKKELAAKYLGNALTLAIVFGIVFMVVGVFTMDSVLQLLGASEEVFPHAQSYLSIIFYGAVFQCVSMAGNNFSRAQGNPKNAMISQLIGALFNILFDYIFIVEMGWGMRGAALATVGGLALSAIWQVSFLFSDRTIIKVTLTLMRLQLEKVFSILKTGLPAFLMQISNSVLSIVLNIVLLQFGGDIALSAIGIVTSVQTLMLMPLYGLMQGQQPLVSYNYGKKDFSRMRETMKFANIGSLIIAGIGFISIQLFSVQIVMMFNQEVEVVALASNAMRIFFLVLPCVGLQIMGANFFQAVGEVKLASFFNLLRQIILLIPLIILFAYLFGLYGVFFAVPCADLISMIITRVKVRSQMQQVKMECCETKPVS